MEEAETVPQKNQRVVEMHLGQQDKFHFVGKCGEFKFVAQMTRSGSPENMGSGRIKRFNMFQMQGDIKKLGITEVASYNCGWETYPSKEDEILAFTFIRFSLEKMDPKELAD
jgi:hypothetical protein